MSYLPSSIPEVGYPSCLQATWVSVCVHPSPLTVPHLWSKHISSLPSFCDLPPTSFRSPSLHEAMCIDESMCNQLWECIHLNPYAFDRWLLHVQYHLYVLNICWSYIPTGSGLNWSRRHHVGRLALRWPEVWIGSTLWYIELLNIMHIRIY